MRAVVVGISLAKLPVIADCVPAELNETTKLVAIVPSTDTDPAAVIVNPLGAGDAFCAGVIWGIHQGWTPERALGLGHRAAAECLKGETATGSIPDLDTLLTGL